MKNFWSLATIVVAVIFFGRWVVGYVIARELMDHTDACHSEVRVAERINRDLDRREIDALFDQYKTCMQQKVNAIDALIGVRKYGDAVVEAMREDRLANGAPRGRHKS